MKSHSLENVFAVVDFDRTASKSSYPFGETGERIDHTSHGFLKNNLNIDPNFLLRTKELYDYYYHEVERNENMKEYEKRRKMIEWPMKVHELYREYLTQEILEESLRGCVDNLHLREGMADFLSFLRKKNVPVLIYSAGISNVIHQVLDNNDLSEMGIVVHGNMLEFDDDGKCIVPSEEKLIHTENKTWDNLPDIIKSGFSLRTHMIVMGDSFGDLAMGDTSKDVYNIGFLAQAHNDPEKFRALYDTVIESEECDLGQLAKITKQLESA